MEWNTPRGPTAPGIRGSIQSLPRVYNTAVRAYGLDEVELEWLSASVCLGPAWPVSSNDCSTSGSISTSLALLTTMQPCFPKQHLLVAIDPPSQILSSRTKNSFDDVDASCFFTVSLRDVGGIRTKSMTMPMKATMRHCTMHWATWLFHQHGCPTTYGN
jgi:hypothetical protein